MFLFLGQSYNLHATMFSSVAPSKDSFVIQARNAREMRQTMKCQHDSAIKIQRVVRGWLCRKRLWREMR